MNKKNDSSWRVWDRPVYTEYGHQLQERATGARNEMEASKSLCKILKDIYKKGMRVADVGCGPAHYLYSLRKRLDENIDYTGIDATQQYLELAKDTFGQSAEFILGDVLDIPCLDKTFDLVLCNNLLIHLPPSPKKAIKELMRLSRQHVVIRTICGPHNYVIKQLLDDDILDTSNYCYLNIYTRSVLRSLIEDVDKTATVTFLDDDAWKPFDNSESLQGTKTMGKHQVSGNLIIDGSFIIISK